MEQTILDKFNTLKELSKKSGSSRSASVHPTHIANDSLSKSIRTKRDAEIFSVELANALKAARKS